MGIVKRAGPTVRDLPDGLHVICTPVCVCMYVIYVVRMPASSICKTLHEASCARAEIMLFMQLLGVCGMGQETSAKKLPNTRRTRRKEAVPQKIERVGPGYGTIVQPTWDVTAHSNPMGLDTQLAQPNGSLLSITNTGGKSPNSRISQDCSDLKLEKTTGPCDARCGSAGGGRWGVGLAKKCPFLRGEF